MYPLKSCPRGGAQGALLATPEFSIREKRTVREIGSLLL